MDKKITLTARDYTVGWLCALPASEEVAAIGMLDHQHEPVRLRVHDENMYTYGDINHHNVVITCLPPGQSGPVSAQKLVQPLQESFPNMRIHLFVGIGGGVPRNPQPEDPDEDIHLGDVVVGVANSTGAPGVVHWDRRRMTGQSDLPLLSIMDKPARQLTNAVGAMERERIFKRNHFHEQLAKLKDSKELKNPKEFEYPGRENDRLYQADDSEELVIRTPRAEQHPVFHKGTILSGSSTMENAKERDLFSKKIHDAMCFETEAAGVDEKHCLVIRGISDYADRHKGYSWHSYAAGAAAAFARQLLYTITAPEVENMPVADSQNLTRREVRKWLNAPDPGTNQNTAEGKRMSDTGLWFVDGQVYKQWRSDPASLLWLHGFAGCGKTVLCSTIIRHTEEFATSESSALIFYYFDFRSDMRARTDSCIQSILTQLANQSLDLKPLEMLHQKYQKFSGSIPRRQELLGALRRMVKGFEHVYIILDALDECGDRIELFEIIDTLRDWKLPQLHILLTSRDEPGIRESLDPTPGQQVSLKNSGIDDDINLFIAKTLERERRLHKWNELIKQPLMEGAKGMFRWVECQIEALRSCRTLAMVKKALKTLPRSLDETYERILKRIDPEHHNYVIRLLQWLCLADGPIEYESLKHALAVSPGEDKREEPSYDTEDCFESFEDIIALCPDFLNACKKRYPVGDIEIYGYEVDALQLTHYSVKEFLMSNRFPEAPNPIHLFKINVELANLALIKSSLVYLIRGSEYLHIQAKNVRDLFHKEAQGFSNRAAREWVGRYRDAQYDRTSTELAASYLTGTNVYFRNEDRKSAIIFAVSHKLYAVAKHLIEDRHIDLNFNVKVSSFFDSYEGLTPLHIACCGEKLGFIWSRTEPCSDLVQLLLNNNADVNALNDKKETPLLYLLGVLRLYVDNYTEQYLEQYIKIIEILLHDNAEVNTSDTLGMTPLHGATGAPSGGNAIVEILLQYNADITARNNFGETPLLAALGGASHCVYLIDSPGRLLDLLWFKGSQLVKNLQGQNALHYTCKNVSEESGRPQEIVNWLVSKGVDLHARDENGLTPILAAAQREIDTPFQALVPHIKERSTFRGCLAAHLFGPCCRALKFAKVIFTHDPEPLGDIKNNVGVLSRYLVEKYGTADWSALAELLLEEVTDLEDNMGMWDTVDCKIFGRAWSGYSETKFEITKWLAKKLRDEGPGLLTLELCNAVMRLLEPPPNEGGDISLKTNDSQSSQGNDDSEYDWDIDSEASQPNRPTSWASTVDAETIRELKHIRAIIFDQIYGEEDGSRQ